ncbi:hypothetical protein [Burkholderia cepacia]|uniref:hypothetical protein n=1 Tax=Burkholderia cepacia TaxID=292 RepID=UPI00264EEC54|nr:hypothetical protein [Burkholderia cepacia]MDN7611243.1 hypothetical protein [Burkholderia cepacia]
MTNHLIESLENAHLKLQAAQQEFTRALRAARRQPMYAAAAQIVDALALDSYRIAYGLEQAARAPWPVPTFTVQYDQLGAGHAPYALYGGEVPAHHHGITDPGYSHSIYSHITTAR